MRAAGLTLAVGTLAACAAGPGVERVIIVSIDGLRPEFYRTNWEAPALRSLAREGAHARSVESVYPSLTYPAHATIVTGVRPARHGIVANTLFGEEGGRRERYWWEKDLKARTLWQAARERGKKVAILSWPTTVGADVDRLIAQVWDPDGKETLKRLQAAASPGLLVELALAVGMPSQMAVEDKSLVDRTITRAACYVLRRHNPDLMLIHLVQVDEVQHREGRDSAEVRRAVLAQDANIALIRKAIEESGAAEKTLLIVTGDHGFMSVFHHVHPNTLLAEAGLIELEGGALKSWKALAHAQGGSAAVYVKDRADIPQVTEVLRAGAHFEGKRLFTLIERPRLDGLGYNPDAALALEAEEGYTFLPALVGPRVEPSEGLKGTHGHLPTRAELLTGFIAWGAGVRPGASVDRMRLVDIAPTVARLLGLEMPGVEGDVLDALLR